MSKSSIKLYDSTLRDGAQTKGVNFSLDDIDISTCKLRDLFIGLTDGGLE